MIRNLTVILLLSSSMARAQPPVEPEADDSATPPSGEYDPRDMRTSDFDEIARARFVVGQRLYEAGRFADAATEFERAFEISGRSSLLFNAYLAHRDAGNLTDAVRTLEAYLRETPDAADHVQLTNRLNAMRETLASDQREQADTRAAAEAERQRLLEEAEQERQRTEAQRQRAEQAERRLAPVGLIGAGVGLAMVVAGGAMAFVAKSRSDSIQDACPTDRCPRLFDLGGELARARRAQRTTDVLVLGGAGIMVGGLIMAFVLRPNGEDSDDAIRPVAACTGDGCAFGATGSF